MSSLVVSMLGEFGLIASRGGNYYGVVLMNLWLLFMLGVMSRCMLQKRKCGLCFSMWLCGLCGILETNWSLKMLSLIGSLRRDKLKLDGVFG